MENKIKDLINHWNYDTYLIDFLEDNKEDVLEYIKEDSEPLIDFQGSQYLSDFISELADSRVDIYYLSLRQWLVENYDIFEEAVEEGLIDTSTGFDLHKAIQTAQFMQIERKLRWSVEALETELKAILIKGE